MSGSCFTVGLTCVGGRYMYDIVRALKAADDFAVVTVGIDAEPDSRGRRLVDYFKVVPIAKDGEEEYCNRLVSICQQHSVNVLIVGSEAETRAIARHRQLFASSGVKTTADNTTVASIVTDKLELFNFLRARGIDVGDYTEVNSIGDAWHALEAFGYPKRDVVFKPRHSTGSRGVLIADPKEFGFRILVEGRFCGVGSFEAIVEAMRKQSHTFREYLAMPYYGGDVYDVDCLARLGEPALVVPRLRQYQNPLSPVNEGCMLQTNSRVVQYVEALCRALGVHGACDFDIAHDGEAAPRLLDASCRMSGSVGASFVAGVNIPAQLVRIFFDLPLHQYTIPNGTCVRPIEGEQARFVVV